MQVIRPVVPLNSGLGIVIGVLSYNGTISFGLSGDPAIMDDLAEFREMLEKSFQALIKSVATLEERKSKKSAPKKAPAKRPATVKKKAAVKKKVAAKKKSAA